MNKEKILGTHEIGERGSLTVKIVDGKFIMPEIYLDVGNGEGATISLQDMSIKQIRSLGEFMFTIAARAEDAMMAKKQNADEV